jgi:queuosine precursor transporter
MTLEQLKNVEGGVFLLFCVTIPAANWMIGHAGEACSASSPCVAPVAPGVMAPCDVLMIGAALVLRELTQRRLGVEFGIASIVAGGALSAGLAPGALVFASATAFLLSELADFAVYSPLARRRLVTVVFVERGRPGDRLGCVLVARFRFARIFARSDYRQSLDGVIIPAVGCLSPPPR